MGNIHLPVARYRGHLPVRRVLGKDEILAKAWFSYNYALWAIFVLVARLLLTALLHDVPSVAGVLREGNWRDPTCSCSASRSKYRESWPRNRFPSQRRQRSTLPTDTVDTTTTETSLTNRRGRWIPVVVLAAFSLFGGICGRSRTPSSDPSSVAPTPRGRARAGALQFAFILSQPRPSRSCHLHRVRHPCVPQRAERRRHRPDRRGRRLRGVVLENAWYIDIGVARLVSGPLTAVARFLSGGVDKAGIDGAVNGIATAGAFRRTAPTPTVRRR